MCRFDFIGFADTIGGKEAFKTFAAPSPSREYSLTIKYYRNESLLEGDYYTRDLPDLFSEVVLFIRKKDKGIFAAFKYDGNVWVRRHIVDGISYDDIMNLSEISTDIQNEWETLVARASS